MITIFWVALVTFLFAYVGYPFLLTLISMVSKKLKVDETYIPSVSVIIPVYNEEKTVERKIENCLSLEYPREQLDIVLASDGSTDSTLAIARKYQDRGVRIFDFPRAGKLATINRVVPEVTSEIVVLTDVSAMFASDALLKMVRYFVDDHVGVVTGVEKISKKNDYISMSECVYWQYETRLKELESRIYSTVGANGPIYAIRRELFPSLPSNQNICDDMAISLSVIGKGKRIVLEPSAIALEEPSLSIQDEWRRKQRISTGAWQALFYYKRLLVPFLSPIALPLIFHKLLRWLTLLFLILMLISNVFVPGTFGRVFLIIQACLYVLSITGIVLMWRTMKLPAPIASLSYFMLTNVAQVIGLYNAVFNKGKPSWQPIERRSMT